MNASDLKINSLCLNPFVGFTDDVFTADEAKHIIELGQKDLKPAKVLVGPSAKKSDKRTNLATNFNQWDDPVATDIATRASGLVRLPPENCEPAKLLYYEGDQKFDEHLDGFYEQLGQVEQLERGGQRLFTTLCYLNEVPEGGATVFPGLKIAVRPKVGRVLVFSNTIPGTNHPHPHSAHTGTSVGAKGCKWVLSLWWRERMYYKPRTYPETEGPMRHY